jgi:hypothetical protein
LPTAAVVIEYAPCGPRAVCPEEPDEVNAMSETGQPAPARPQGRYLLLLSLTALGVVYGDIGTSPLYAVRECFHGPHALPPFRRTSSASCR